jgi:hypothetical protein
MSLGLLLFVLILAFNVFISLWNSYNAGQLRPYNRGLSYLFFALGGFLPMSYVVASVLTLILAYFGYLSFSTFEFLVNFEFLFFGLALVIWGVIATVTTAVAFARTRDWKAGLITAWNAFATIFNIYTYASNALSAWRRMRGSAGSADWLDIIAVIGISLAIGFLISYGAYKLGARNSRVVTYAY